MPDSLPGPAGPAASTRESPAEGAPTNLGATRTVAHAAIARARDLVPEMNPIDKVPAAALRRAALRFTW